MDENYLLFLTFTHPVFELKRAHFPLSVNALTYSAATHLTQTPESCQPDGTQLTVTRVKICVWVGSTS